jgi:hypothetical protein
MAAAVTASGLARVGAWPCSAHRAVQVHQARAGDRMFDRHVRAVALHVADDGHFQFGAGGQGRLAGFGRDHRAVRGGDPQRGAEAGTGADHQGRAAGGGFRSAQVQHATGVNLRGGIGHGFEVVDDEDPLQADVGFHLARRQRPRQVGGDHRAVLAGVAGTGDHAVRGPRAFAEEVGQDRAEACMVGVAVLAVLQHLHRMGGITAGLDPGHAHMGATDVGGQERGRDSGQDMGRGGVAGGHAGSCCRWGRPRDRGRRLGRSL